MTSLAPYPTLPNSDQLSDVIAAINQIARIRQNDIALVNQIQNQLTPGAATNPVTSLTGDGVIFSNSASTGAVTLTQETNNKNLILASSATTNGQTATFRALVAADLPIATASALGGVEPDGTIITVSGSGGITVAKASSSVFGVVKVDGTTITASGGVISATSSLMTALGVGSVILAGVGSNNVGSPAGTTTAAANLTSYGLNSSSIALQSTGDSLAGTWRSLQTPTDNGGGGPQVVLWQRVA